MINTSEKETKYRLYRSVKEILHPTISKKNISNYQIILEEGLLPIQVLYPKKISNLEQVIIYIHGNEEITECKGKYDNYLKELSIKTNSLVISIEYEERKEQYEEIINECSKVIEHITSQLLDNKIDINKIILMGDSTGGNIITSIHLKNKEIKIKKEVLLYPALSLEYFGKTNYESIHLNEELNYHLLPRLKKYYKRLIPRKELEKETFNAIKKLKETPKTLLLLGSVDSLKDEAVEYSEKNKNSKVVEFSFLSHGFIKRMEDEEKELMYSEIIKWIDE